MHAFEKTEAFIELNFTQIMSMHMEVGARLYQKSQLNGQSFPLSTTPHIIPAIPFKKPQSYRNAANPLLKK
jgi:hypothetical protein